ncbi:MAG: glycogen synthase, partial [Ignavibacteriae bacterium]|nr:glycogen synthase [Ignavibacteriota bacterium]
LKANVKSSFITASNHKIQVYFLDNQALYGRSGMYIHPESKKDYVDNDTRFIFFSRGVLEVLKRMGWQPDIIHCNDWQTGLIPAYLKTLYKEDPFYKKTKTVFTMHNMAYQGIFPKTSFTKTLLPKTLLSEKGIESQGCVNFLKAGIVFSDALTTVSRKYALEIRTNGEYGFGLQSLINRRRKNLHGILNGIDYSVWNPAIDETIPHKYDVKSFDLKIENKKALLARMKMPFKETTPLLGIISRLAEQKGFDLIDEILEPMMNMDLQLIVLGVGEKRYHEILERASRMYPGKVGVHLSFSADLAHWIEAGSDIFLMPSKYEPCGLNQMYSLKYGTVPIVRATGGLDDTIQDFDPRTGKGTGFKFTKYDGGELLRTIQRAVELFADRATWRKIVRNGMSEDFSWESSAKKYLQLYRSLARK